MKTRVWLLLIILCMICSSQGQNIPAYERKAKADSMRRHTGYFNYTQFGIGVRLGNPVFAISTVNGYQFSHRISLGLGIGYSNINYPLWNERYLWTAKMYKSAYLVNFDQVNLFLEPRFFLGRKYSFFLFMDLGYSFPLSQKDHYLTKNEIYDWVHNFPDTRYDTLIKTSYSGTFFFAPGGGYKVIIHKNISLNFSLQLFVAGIRTKETLVEYGNIYDQQATKMNLYPLFSIGIGF